MGQFTVFSGPERRRRWSDDQRRQILEEAFLAGACVSRVARRHDVSTALIYTRRRKLFQPVTEPNSIVRSFEFLSDTYIAAVVNTLQQHDIVCTLVASSL